MNARPPLLPMTVFTDAATNDARCVNGLHVQTFIANPHGEGTLVTFINGDVVLIREPFDAVVESFAIDEVDG